MGQIIDGAFYSDYDSQDIDRRLAIAGGVSNLNLLNNPWFTVNQRGVTSGSFDNKYYLDRWLFTYGSAPYGTWTLSNDGLTAVGGSKYLRQYFNEPFNNGITLTASYLLSDGTIKTGTGVTSNSTVIFLEDELISLILHGGNDYFTIVFNSNTNTTIRAVKLEPGSVSTLGNDVAPNYDLELQKCRGHVLVVGGDSTVVLTGWMGSTTLMRGNTLTDLNFTPTTISMTGSFYVYAGGSLTGASSIALQNSNKHNIDVTTSAALPNNAIAIMRGVNSNSKIIISDGLG